MVTKKSIVVLFLAVVTGFHSIEPVVGEGRRITIIGSWWIVEETGSPCPDFLVFEENMSYVVLNDCHGLDHKNPVVERGKWTHSIDRADNSIVLLDRETFGMGSIFPKASKIHFHVKSVNQSMIDLCVDMEKQKICLSLKRAELGKD